MEDNNLTCQICVEKYDQHNPNKFPKKVLCCGQILCLNCIESIYKRNNNQILCPFCRKVTNIPPTQLETVTSIFIKLIVKQRFDELKQELASILTDLIYSEINSKLHKNIKMYGQPGMPMYGQPMMQPGMPMMQPGMPMMQPMMPQPMFKQITVGYGIDMYEFNKIVSAATFVYQSRQTPLSTLTANYIKQNLGGEWLVVTYPIGSQYDFCLSSVTGGDFMSFSLDNTLYQICRLRY